MRYDQIQDSVVPVMWSEFSRREQDGVVDGIKCSCKVQEDEDVDVAGINQRFTFINH